MIRPLFCFFIALACLVPAPARAQSIIINELMYDSASHGTNEEWVELYNAGTNTVNLLGWKFTKGVNFAFPSQIIHPGGFVVVAANLATFIPAHPGVDGDYIIGGWLGALANGGETIRLEDPLGSKIDEITYADQGDWGQRIRGPLDNNHRGWDWLTPHSGTGKSVELVNRNLPRDSGQNWVASTVDGGTPGAANSVQSFNSRALVLDTAHLPLVPRSTNVITIAARVVVPPGTGVTVRLFYRVDANPQSNPFTAEVMNDNGLSGDGGAGDDVYGTVLAARPNLTVLEYYVEAVTASGVTNSWPAPASIDGVFSQSANALLQVDDSSYGGGQPFYRVLMNETERAELTTLNNTSGDRNSDAQMNATFISIDGTSSELRHLNGLRIRGAGSRGQNPPNYRLNISSDRPWKGVSQINLNTQFTHSQLAGYALAARSGMDAETARAVQVRVNGANLALANSPQFGSYVATEVPGGEFVDAHFPQDNGGNIYRASTGSHSASLGYLGTSVPSYTSAGYSKQNNSTENDWTDLMNLTFALSPNTSDANYVPTVRQAVNVEQWMLYFALYTLTISGETSLGTGFGDDFGMYRGGIDPRFKLLVHDWDTIYGQGSGPNFSTGTNLFRATALSTINRFLKHPEFVPTYFATLNRLLDTTFSNAELSRTMDDALGSWVPAATITAMKTSATNRNAYVRSQIPLAISIQSSLPVVGGYPQSSSATATLFGFSDAIHTRTVLVNGSTSVWSAWEARWTNASVALQPGVNRVLVQALNSNGVEIATANIDIWRNVAGTAVSGAISSDATWTAANGPFTVSGALTINADVTLTIQSGASVFFNSGASLNVADGGRLLAEGTATAPIRFTRVPGSGATWGGLIVNGTPGSPETRLAYAHLEFNSSSAINVQGGEVYLDHLTFGATGVRYLNLDGASFLVSHCHFPATTASIEPIHGTGGIRTGGHGVFVRNFCGKVNGYNDTIDFTGGNRPGPIVHFIENVFTGSDDDILDLDGTDAWVEGNIFLHVHRNGSPDSASGVSGGNDSGQTSEITVLGNIFYDVDQAATAKQGNFYTFLNNTVVRQTGAGFGDAATAAVLNFGDDGIALASGLFAEGNVIYDAQRLTRNVTNGTALASNITFNHNLMPFTWAGPGSGNSTNDPLFVRVPQWSETTNFTTWQQAQVLREWFAVRAGSPAVGTGPNGRDRGGVVPTGASISGEPEATTATNGATLVVGVNRAVPGWTDGSGFTHYKWRLDGGAWSAETPLATPIALAGLGTGSHRVDVSGRRDSGLYQDDLFFGSTALASSSRTWVVTNKPGRVLLNEVLAVNRLAFPHEGETPDVIELFNPGTNAVNLAGKGITDDPNNHYKFAFPTNTTLGPGQYLLVYADESKVTSGIHLGFALSERGDSIYLYESSAGGGALLDSISFGLQLEDLSLGRLTGGSWGLSYPTLGAANTPYPLGDLSRLKINEWLADATVGEDFVEVLNLDSLPVNIGGSFFSDAPASAPLLHQVPALSFIAGGAYLPFIADADAGQGADHLSFKLSPVQGSIALFSPAGVLIDCVIYGPQATDISEGRSPNGGDARAMFSLPTPGSPNPFSSVSITVSNSLAVLFGVTNQIWRYNDTGFDFETDWLPAAFDDSGWPAGRGLFGFETSPGLYPFPFNTFSPSPQNGGPITVYYRTHFQWTNGSGWQFFATNYLDDGAVIYLNGVEAGRLRVTANPVLFTSQAQTQGSEGQPEVIALSSTALVEGDNVIAVEVHQSDNGSSDDVFGLSLYAVKSVTNFIATAIALNEVMANNQSYTNADGLITDWIEIYNPTASPVDVGDMSLSDDVAVPRRWVFPAGAAVPALGYLTVKFDSGTPASTNAGPGLNTGFGFKASGDEVLLFDKLSRGGALFDSVQFGLQAADFTIGRVPNGVGAWGLTLPTEGSLNLAASLASAATVRVNEWMADAKSGDDDYFELFNPNAQPVALGGFYLTDNLISRTQYKIPNLSFIGLGGRGFVQFIADNNPGAGADHVNFRLAGSGEAVGFFATDGLTQIDAVTFGLQQSGVSEGRFPDGATNRVRFPRTPTPGQANFLPFEDVVMNEALTHSDPPLEDAIELFNPTARPIDIGGWYLSDSQLEPRKFRIADNTILQPGGFTVLYENQFNPTLLFPSFSLSSANGDEIFLSVTDTNGNLTGYRASVDFGAQANGVTFGRFETSIGFDFPALSSRTLGVDSPASVEQFRTGSGATNAYPQVGAVVISEIHYHPPELGTNDNARDEFIELHNASASAVALFDPNHFTNTWHLRSAVDFDFATNTWIAAGGFLVVVGFDPQTNATDLAAFRLRYGLSPAVPLVGPWNGKLNNGDDEIRLNRPDAPNLGDVPYILVERIHYRDSAPWPSAADGNTNGSGVSLQRAVALNYANDPVNWRAALPTPGASNGAAVLAPPVFTVQPTNRTVLPGTAVSMTALATGVAPLTYQWRWNGVDLAGATNAAYAIVSAQTTNAGLYSVRAVNPAGAALTTNALLTIQAGPQIVYQPLGRTVAAGGTASFTVGAIGTGPLNYQWWKDGGSVLGATQPTLVLTNVQAPDLGIYLVVITNSFGSTTSAPAALQLSVPPQIVAQPINRTVIIGATVSFEVGVTGSAPLYYQWLFNGVTLSGATSTNLVFTNVQPARSGTYSVLVSNAVGSALSSNATLLVIVPPTVTIAATDPGAAEQGLNPGVFTVTRNGSNNFPVTVNFSVAGGALNGTDYQSISSQVTIPAGTNAATITILPVDEATIEADELVTLTLLAAPEYLIGSPSNATVTIVDNDNLPPVVVITTPTNGTFVPFTPTNLLLAATASDPNPGQGVSVTFYFGPNAVSPLLAAPYQFTWTNPPTGSNLLFAVATDALGRNATSAPVALSINGPPLVSIASPTNGAALPGPGNIGITATATDTNGGVARVDLYVGGVLLASLTNAPYFATLSNAPLAAYQTYAVARDPFGLVSTSAVVNFSVVLASTNLADSFNGRGILNGFTNFLTGNNNAATLEVNEPNHYFTHAVKTMWLEWTAPASGLVTMDTVGSAFDTILVVYTNRPGLPLNFTSLVQMAVSDDASGLQSSVTFPAIYGTTYYIVVAGYDTSTPNGGAVQFRLGLPGGPFISAQPASRTNDVGTSASFTVAASGQSALVYQWRFNGVNIGGASGANFTRTNVQLVHAGNYDVRVVNSFGSVTSAVALLTVRDSLPLPFSILRPRLSNGVFSATLAGGSTNRSYAIEVAPNLTNWTTLLTVSNLSGEVSFTDTNSLPPTSISRGYRARLVP